MKRKLWSAILSVPLVLSLYAIPADAATSGTTTTTVTVQPGSLDMTNVTASVNLGTVVVDGTVKNVNGAVNPITVSDQRGVGDGWNLTVSASQFTQTGGVPTPLKLDTNTFKLNGISNITQTNGSSTLPTAVGASPWFIDSGAVKILSAANGAGLGDFQITFPANALTLSVDTSKGIVDPLNNPTVYESTITWQLNVGP